MALGRKWGSRRQRQFGCELGGKRKQAHSSFLFSAAKRCHLPSSGRLGADALAAGGTWEM